MKRQVNMEIIWWLLTCPVMVFSSVDVGTVVATITLLCLGQTLGVVMAALQTFHTHIVLKTVIRLVCVGGGSLVLNFVAHVSTAVCILRTMLANNSDNTRCGF